MRREYHFVYGTTQRQAWQESALGWQPVDLWDADQWPMGSYIPVEWPSKIPEPIRPGCPPRQTY